MHKKSSIDLQLFYPESLQIIKHKNRRRRANKNNAEVEQTQSSLPEMRKKGR